MLPNYDIRTLAISIAAMSFVFGAWLLYCGWRRERYPGYGLWVAAALSGGLGMGLLSFRNEWPDFLTIIVANTLILLFLALLFMGVERFNGIDSGFLTASLAVVSLAVLLFLYWTYVDPYVAARVAVGSLTIAAVSLLALRSLAKNRADTRSRGMKPGVAAFSVLLVWFTVRAVYTLLVDYALTDFMTAGFMHQVTFFVMLCTGMILLFWVIFMTSERLREDLSATNIKLQTALDEVRTLRGIVPICVSCKKIRNESGEYEALEGYITRHTEANFSHAVCLECADKLYPEFRAGKASEEME